MAALLDPIRKLKWFKFWFHRLWKNDSDKQRVTKEVAKVKNIFQKVFDEYNHLPPAANVQATMSVETSSTVYSGADELEFESYKELDEKADDKSELDRYLDDPGEPDDPTFSILAWWKMHERKFPVLARMARDILAIPLSTVSSESAFSTGGRVVEPHRSSLLPSTVEGLICAQNWMVSTSGIIEDFAALSLEDYEEDPDMIALETGIQADTDSIINSLKSLKAH